MRTFKSDVAKNSRSNEKIFSARQFIVLMTFAHEHCADFSLIRVVKHAAVAVRIDGMCINAAVRFDFVSVEDHEFTIRNGAFEIQIRLPCRADSENYHRACVRLKRVSCCRYANTALSENKNFLFILPPPRINLSRPYKKICTKKLPRRLSTEALIIKFYSERFFSRAKRNSCRAIGVETKSFVP